MFNTNKLNKRGMTIIPSFFSFFFSKKNMTLNLCRYTVSLYLLPMILLIVKKKEVHLQLAFLCLSYYGFQNHCRGYNTEIYYDFIDIIDRFCIIYICYYFIYNYYYSFIVWFALFYMIFVYFIFIPKLKLSLKIIAHCSFHLVSLASALILLA